MCVPFHMCVHVLVCADVDLFMEFMDIVMFIEFGMFHRSACLRNITHICGTSEVQAQYVTAVITS